MWLAIASASASAILLVGCAKKPSTAATAAASRSTEKVFPDPKAAVHALLAACRTDDQAAFVTIFGEETAPLVRSAAAGSGPEGCRRFRDAAHQMTRLDPTSPNTLQLVVGSDDWPFPVPLVRDGSGWRFDSRQGAEEMLRRQVGNDELEAIAFCRVYIRAQEDYASRPRDGRTKAYAEKLVSTPGRKDGLYWPSPDKGDETPLGREVAVAGDYARGKQPPSSWWGYYFRVLTAQGKEAPGGARRYVVDGKMIGGFALVAYPVEYGSSGIMTFIVNKDGRVYQKDLGEKTDAIVAAMTAYDPDASWKLVSD
jgi:DUF2950 family protein